MAGFEVFSPDAMNGKKRANVPGVQRLMGGSDSSPSSAAPSGSEPTAIAADPTETKTGGQR
jgi:hypothetical protein